MKDKIEFRYKHDPTLKDFAQIALNVGGENYVSGAMRVEIALHLESLLSRLSVNGKPVYTVLDHRPHMRGRQGTPDQNVPTPPALNPASAPGKDGKE